MITQKDLEQLALLKAEAEKSTHLLEQFQQETVETVTQIAFKYYPLLKERDIPYIHKFRNLVSELSWEFAIEMEHLALEADS